MAKNVYKPGSRNPKFRIDGKMSENRVTWLRTILGTAVIMFYPPGVIPDDATDEEKDQTGPTVRLIIPQPGRRAVSLNLTALTSAEIVLMREFYNLLFDLAEPIVRERDKVAQNAYENGDDSFARIYRQVPQLVVRSGAIGPDYESVRNRLDDLSRGVRDGFSSADGVRRVGTELASSEPEKDRTQDDEPQTDKP